MAHPRYGDSKLHTTPRWVKVSLIIVTVLILALVALGLAGVGGDHGPGRHLRGGGGGITPTPGVTEPGVHKPSPRMDHSVPQP